VHDDVRREESFLVLLFPVFSPAPHFQPGYEGLDVLVREALVDHVFMPAPGVDAVPQGNHFVQIIAHGSQHGGAAISFFNV
jgi:hypothetical protein